VFDTHAGAGLYRLDGDYAQTSGEAAEGFYASLRGKAGRRPRQQRKISYTKRSRSSRRRSCRITWRLVAGFNSKPGQHVYPGSPFIIQRLLRERDKLKLFELHPTDAKTLTRQHRPARCRAPGGGAARGWL